MLQYAQLKRALQESVLPRNNAGGFLSVCGDRSTELLNRAVRNIKDAAKSVPGFDEDDGIDEVQIGHFLDSPGGRHLGEMMLDGQDAKVIKAFLKKSLDRFVRNYDAGAFDDAMRAQSTQPEKVSESVETYNNRAGTHGIFSMHPHRREKALGSIKKLMREPLKAHEASDKLQPHIPDPKLHANIKHFIDQDPSVDVRPVVKKRLRELRVRGY